MGNIDTEFCNLNQGTLSITDYCRKMKTLADSIVELDEPMTDHVLTLNVLCGLYERFEYIRSFLKRQRPLSKFVEVCSELLLEELSMAPPSVVPTAPTTALVASAPAPSPRSTSSSAGGGGGGNRRRCRKTGDSQSGAQSGGAWPSVTIPGQGPFTCGQVQCRGTGPARPSPPAARFGPWRSHTPWQLGKPLGRYLLMGHHLLRGFP